MWVPEFHIQRAIQALDHGKIIAYPTESVFGLGCDPENTNAILQLLHIKQRPASKGLILIASNINQLEYWVDFDQIPNVDAMLASWPGHETWLVPVQSHVSSLLTGEHETLAVRVSNHPVVVALCDNFGGAITSTSANKSNQREAKNLFTSKKYFNDQVDYYLPGVVSGHLKPSRIRDARTGQTIRN